MTCPGCGRTNKEYARFCQFCGHALVTGEDATAVPEPVREEVQEPIVHPHYAGFWRRFLAILIDKLVLGTISFLLSASYFLAIVRDTDTEAFGIAVLSNRIFSFLLNWIYFTLMESSSKQATLGKTAIGIIVTDYDGRRISFLRANGRYFGKFLSAFFLGIGFVMAGFTRRKQALHDFLAKTLVVLK